MSERRLAEMRREYVAEGLCEDQNNLRKELAQVREMAEKLEMDPVEFRILNDTQVDPNDSQRPFLSVNHPSA